MNTNTTHKCYACKESKPATDFYAKSGRPGKLLLVCKPCLAARYRERYRRHTETKGYSMSASHRARLPLNYVATLLTIAEEKLVSGDLERSASYLDVANARLSKLLRTKP